MERATATDETVVRWEEIPPDVRVWLNGRRGRRVIIPKTDSQRIYMTVTISGDGG